MRRMTACLLAMICLIAPAALAEMDGDCVYTLLDESGSALTQRACRMYVGDEYIAQDDRLYRVTAVDDVARTASARCVGEAVPDAQAFSALAESKSDGGRRLIAMYSTHSDESYVPDDGTESKWRNAGIYDVGDSLKKALEERGIETIYSRETFLPHDADAYTRSRRTAETLLKKGPDALIDVHRDAVSAEQYETRVDGEDISKVRLFVGRTNPNAAANRAFAQQLKAAADREYPGLVKDIFIGRGNYNQDISPNSILLEFGTHEIDKDKAIAATGYMAEVLDAVLYGSGAKAEGRGGATAKNAMKGVGWAVLALGLAGAVFAFLSTGSLPGAWQKLKRHASEVTGGLLGDRPRDRR